jgi:hypothetical protein
LGVKWVSQRGEPTAWRKDGRLAWKWGGQKGGNWVWNWVWQTAWKKAWMMV